MANIKSQIKRNRQNEKRHKRNQGVRSSLKTATKKATTAAASGDVEATSAAVNEASRIERLCDVLGRHLVMSQSFARAADASRHELVSLGRHRLRGVREETELFGLAP